MRRSIAGWCAAALCLVTLTACANTATDGSGSPASSPNVSLGSPASAPPGTPSSAPGRPGPSITPITPAPPHSGPPIGGPPVTVGPPRPIESSDGTMTLSGQIFAGAEPSCLLMTQGQIQYLLITGDSSRLRAGQRAVVTGHVVRGLRTHCMQGLPFQVTNVDPLTPN